MVCSGGVWVSAISHTATGAVSIPGAFSLPGDISPAQITANQNDYNPAGLAAASVLRLNTNASRNVTGLQTGSDGRIVTIVNVGTFPIVLMNDVTSTAANRFLLGADVTLAANQSVTLIYDSTSSRWRPIGPIPSAGTAAGGSDRQMQFNNAGVLGGVPGFNFQTDGALNYYYWDTATANATFAAGDFYLDVAPSGNQTAGRRQSGFGAGAGVTAGNTFQIRNVRGVTGYAGNAGTGAVEQMDGLIGYAENTGNATVSGALQGLWSGARVTAGTVTTARGAYLDVTVAGGTTTTVQGLAIGFNHSAGTITNRYGLFFDTPGGTATNDYGIYQTGAQRNYFGGGIQLANDLSPAQITATTSNYAPTGIAGASVLRLSTNASRDLTGITTGADGRILTIINIGTNPLVLKNDITSTAANRFLFGADVTLAANQSMTVIYDSTTQRWRPFGALPSSGGGTPGGSDREIQFNNASAFGGVPNYTFNTDGSLNYYYYDTATANANFNLMASYTDVAPSAAQTAGRRVVGLSGGAGVPAGNTFQIRRVEGTTGYAGNAGTGAVEQLSAIVGYAENTSNATVSNAVQGLWGGGYVSAGTVNIARGAALDVTVAGGTVTQVQGLLINLNRTAGTITNRYGILLDTPGGTATNDWGIYQVGTQNNRLNGALGIGTTPLAGRMLDVSATSGTAGLFYNTGTTGIAIYGSAPDTSASVHYGVYGHATGSAAYALYCQSVNNANGCGGNRAWFNASDERLKDKVVDLRTADGLDAIMQLRPVRYQWKDVESAGKEELGFLAQDVEKVFPELVGTGADVEITLPDGTTQTVADAKSMSYATMVVPLVKAVQELKAENDNLRARLERLEARAE